jgi:2,4-diaminopentanoate dehydrogenase
LCIVQWATGNVGRHAAAAVHRHPDLELVGTLVYSEAKAGRDVGEICGLLASGKNVVSTAVTGLIYPASMGGQIVEKLEAACAKARSSFHGTGIEPGWAAEVLPLTMSGLFGRIDSRLLCDHRWKARAHHRAHRPPRRGPGIRTFLELPTIVGRGVLNG